MQKDESLDCKGLMCPMPIVKLAKKMKELPVGKVLEMISDDIGSKEDVPAWCKRTNNQLVEMERGQRRLLLLYQRGSCDRPPLDRDANRRATARGATRTSLFKDQ